MAGLGGVLGAEASEGARGEVRAGGRVGLSPGRLAGASIKTIAEVAKWPSYISQKTFGLLMGEKGILNPTWPNSDVSHAHHVAEERPGSLAEHTAAGRTISPNVATRSVQGRRRIAICAAGFSRGDHCPAPVSRAHHVAEERPGSLADHTAAGRKFFAKRSDAQRARS